MSEKTMLTKNFFYSSGCPNSSADNLAPTKVSDILQQFQWQTGRPPHQASLHGKHRDLVELTTDW